MEQTRTVTGSTYRFTIITDHLIRAEYQADGQFTDTPTQAIQNRAFTPAADLHAAISQDTQGYAVQIDTPALHLYYRGGVFDGATLFVDTKYNYQTHYSRWHYGDPDEGNLGGTARTLDGADGAIPLGQGIMSRNGLAVLDDSASMVTDPVSGAWRQRPHAGNDVYLFAYGHDYQGALRDFFKLTGQPPRLPRFALGNWWSRYYPYTQKEYLALMQRFADTKIPIAVAVLDMNWHTTDLPAEMGSGWTGFTWNKKYFADPAALLQSLHDQDKHVTLNLHPAAGVRANEESYPAVARAMGIDPATKQPVNFDMNDPRFVRAYFDLVLHPLEKEGVDFWWIDWQQGESRSAAEVDPLWALNVAHYADQSQRKGDHALILSRYAGPGSHRYPIGFSGDTVASWASLAFQPYFTATASNIGYTWWSHDIGGHMRGRFDPELATRWLQLGVFSPILRLHSTDNPFQGKEPWNYDEHSAHIMTRYLRLRRELVPYLESANSATHEDGTPLVEPLYYRHPDEPQAYQFRNEFYFGPEMLVLPITTPADPMTGLAAVTGYIPEGMWTDLFTHQTYTGPGVMTLHRDADHYPVLVREGGIIVRDVDYMAPIDPLPTHLTVDLFQGPAHQYLLREHTEKGDATTVFAWNSDSHQLTLTVTDPAGIIPADRTVQASLVNADAEQPALSLSGNTSGQATFTHVRPVARETQVQPRAWRILQQAHVDFELKRQLWDIIRQQPAVKAAVSVASLAPAALSAALMEVLLVNA